MDEAILDHRGLRFAGRDGTPLGGLPGLSLTEAAYSAEVIDAGGEDLLWRYGSAICLCQIDVLSRPKDSALPGL